MVADRWLRKDHAQEGDSLPWLFAEERKLVLEVDMMNKREVTIPPRTHPLPEMILNYDLSDRREALLDVRWTRIRKQVLRWVRRILTLAGGGSK